MLDKADAFKVMHEQLSFYRSRGYDERLIDDIAEKRAAYINAATSKTEMEKILHPDYNNSPAYGIDTEEIIFWGEASLRYPLRQKDAERFFDLVKKFYEEE